MGVEKSGRDLKMASNPYEQLGQDLEKSIIAGSRGIIQGRQLGLSDRLREYAFWRMENAETSGDALLVNDLLDAARRLAPAEPA